MKMLPPDPRVTKLEQERDEEAARYELAFTRMIRATRRMLKCRDRLKRLCTRREALLTELQGG